MNILLISPITVQKERPKPLWAPLGLAFIASTLQKEGHRVSIFDRHARLATMGLDSGKIDSAMLDHIRGFGPDLIGMNTKSPLIWDTVESVRKIRKVFKGPIVAGGHHASALPELTLKKIVGLDGVVVEEGELPMVKIAAGINPTDIPGVWWKDGNGKISGNAPIQNEDLDRLPFPAHELLDMDYYTRRSFNAFHGRYISSVSVLSSRGCPRRCDFCTESLTYGQGVRFHSTRYVIEWIEKVLADYSTEGIYFLDNDFLVNKDRAARICEQILRRGLNKKFKWVIQARADSINAGILPLLKRAGCVSVEIGVESALQHNLDSIHKGCGVETQEKAIALCRKAGLSVFTYMIIGFPNETLSDLRASLRWVRRAKPTSFGWRELDIYPGTVLYDEKGRSFFEKHLWDKKNIEKFYRGSWPCSISNAERERWLSTRYRPYRTWRRIVAALKQNSLSTLLFYALEHSHTTMELFHWLTGGIFNKRVSGRTSSHIS